MPIVINEFEVVVEPPKPAPTQPGQARAAKEAPAPLRPEDIVRIERRSRERLERVRAD